jgi:hypothetical protein
MKSTKEVVHRLDIKIFVYDVVSISICVNFDPFVYSS